ncbi:MAG: TonB-dependent receptor domain-containing protein, partial [Gemmatimonadaceae bacterium]
MSHCVRRILGIALVLMAMPVATDEPLFAQVGDRGDDAPRFLLARSPTPVRVDVAKTPVLRQRIALDLRGATVEEALRAIADSTGLRFAYSRAEVPVDRPVRLEASDITVAAALTEVLLGTDVDVVFTERGQAMLVRRLPEGVLPQVGTITGRVSDAGTGQSVFNAQVIVVGTESRALSDDDGRYSIGNVPAGAQQVRVMRLGYTPMTQAATVADGQTVTLDFALIAAVSRLEDVVVTVTGEQRRLEVGNVIGTIDADSVVREAPITALSDLINARVPGVQVLQNNGLAGSSPRLRIRGVGSLSGSNPLLIVDGIRVDNSSGGTFLSAGSIQSGRFNDLNPEEIESIDVVKGPSAATLYGTDAANGVVVVKTKRGAPGRTLWNAYAETGFSKQTTDFLDNYHSWGPSPFGARCPIFISTAGLGLCEIDSLTTFNPLTNPETSPLNTGHRQQYGVQASGGVSRFTFFVSGEFEKETGVLEMPAGEQARVRAERGGIGIPDEQIHPNALRRISLRSNIGTTFGSNADMNLSLGLISSAVRITGSSQFGSGFSGSGFRDATDGWPATARPGEVFGVRNDENVTRFTGSLNTNWRPLSWLTTRGTVGLDFGSNFFDALQRVNEGPLGGRIGSRVNRRSETMFYTADLGASAFVTPRAWLSSRTSIGVQYNNRQLGSVTGTGITLLPGQETLSAAATRTATETNTESIVAGAYVEQTFGFNDRLYLTGAVRADGGSQFGRDFETAVYPKGSASWLAVPQQAGWLNSVRLRAAYGASGVQPGPTAALTLLTLSSAIIDGAAATGATLQSVGNSGLKPERQREIEAGFDMELLNRRVRLEATYYDRLSTDAIITRELATDVGLRARPENIGSVSNRGFEGLLSAVVVDHPVAMWDVTLNGSVNRNRVEDLGPGVLPFGPVAGFTVYQFREGYPVAARFARPILGFSDADGDGLIDINEVQVGDTAVYFGDAHPPRQFTLGSSLTLFRRLRIGTQFDYRGGHVAINPELEQCIFFNCRRFNDPSLPLEEQVAAAALFPVFLGSTAITQAGFIEDASFIRWRELSLTYLIPERWAGRLG